MKRCARCHQFLSLNSFYRQSAQPDGLRAYCKECWKTDCAQRHARKREGMVDKRRILMESVRHDYFSQIERPIQAYVLGLLASDGNVSDARPRIALSVHEKDKWLVEVARDELAPMRPITLARHRDYHMAKIALTSPQMVSDLAHFEIVPRKSATLRWPAALPQTLANSYLLGVYDGDGWITRDLRKPVPYFTAGIISASQGFLQAACAAIYEATGLEAPCLSPVISELSGFGMADAAPRLCWLGCIKTCRDFNGSGTRLCQQLEILQLLLVDTHEEINFHSSMSSRLRSLCACLFCAIRRTGLAYAACVENSKFRRMNGFESPVP